MTEAGFSALESDFTIEIVRKIKLSEKIIQHRLRLASSISLCA